MTELGVRVDDAIRAENYGLPAQQIAAIVSRRPPRQDWIMVYEGDVCVRMEWGWVA